MSDVPKNKWQDGLDFSEDELAELNESLSNRASVSEEGRPRRRTRRGGVQIPANLMSQGGEERERSKTLPFVGEVPPPPSLASPKKPGPSLRKVEQRRPDPEDAPTQPFIKVDDARFAMESSGEFDIPIAVEEPAEASPKGSRTKRHALAATPSSPSTPSAPSAEPRELTTDEALASLFGDEEEEAATLVDSRPPALLPEQPEAEPAAGEFTTPEDQAHGEDSRQQEQDSGEQDSGEQDSGEEDSGEEDSGEQDSGEEDSGEEDSGEEDSGEEDSGEEDAPAVDEDSPDSAAAAGVTVRAVLDAAAEALQTDSGKASTDTERNTFDLDDGAISGGAEAMQELSDRHQVPEDDSQKAAERTNRVSILLSALKAPRRPTRASPPVTGPVAARLKEGAHRLAKVASGEVDVSDAERWAPLAGQPSKAPVESSAEVAPDEAAPQAPGAVDSPADASEPEGSESQQEESQESKANSPFPLAADLVAPPRDEAAAVEIPIEVDEVAAIPPPIPEDEADDGVFTSAPPDDEDAVARPPAIPPDAEPPPAAPPKVAKPPPPPQKDAQVKEVEPQKRRPRAWFEEIFDEDYLRTVPQPPERLTRFEVDFFETSLSPTPKSHILDLGCGVGRHAIEFASRGYRVTGLDLSLQLLVRAAEAAQERDLTVNFVHGDFRELAFVEEYDAAICVNTSFGFFDDDSNRKMIRAVNKALKAGGRLLLEVVNRDYMVRDLPSRIWWEGQGCVVLEEVGFNHFTSRLESKRSVVFEDGRHSEQEISIRLYSLHELGKILHHAGFRVLEVSGHYGHRTRLFGQQSRNLVLLAERRH